MANCCSTSFSIQSDNDITSEDAEALRKELEETVCYDGEVYFERCDSNLIEGDCCTKWNVPTALLQPIAKKYAVNIRAIGREDGVGFVQVVCINSTGELVQDDEIGYRF